MIPTSGQTRLGYHFASHYANDGSGLNNSGNVSSSSSAQRNLGAWHSRACTGFQGGNNLRIGAAHGCASMNGASGHYTPTGNPTYNYSPRVDRMTRRHNPEYTYYYDYTFGTNQSNTTGQYQCGITNLGYTNFYGASACTFDAYCRDPGSNYVTTANLYFQYYATTPQAYGDSYTMVLRMYRDGYGIYGSQYGDYYSATPTAYNQWVTVNQNISNFRYDLFPFGVFSVAAITENYHPQGTQVQPSIYIRYLKLRRNS